MQEAQPACFRFREIGIILSQVFRDRALVLAKLCADVFEAGQRFDTAQTVIIGDRLLQVGRDKSFDDHGM